MFYVYEYYNKCNDEVFYVGKGTGGRKDELHNRSSYFKATYQKYRCGVRIIEDNLTNEEACIKEVERISDLKSVGQAYCNFTAGGTGFSTGALNPIHQRIARGEESYFARMKFYGEDNGFYGKTHSLVTKRKISNSRKGKGGRFGKDNPMYGVKRYGADNPMYCVTGEKHHNAKMFEIVYTDSFAERLNAKRCENKFGIAFTRIRHNGGVLHYKKKSKNDIYEGTIVRLV